MKQNKKIWKWEILLILIIFIIPNTNASWFGDIFGGGHCYSWMPPKTAQACDQCGVIAGISGLVSCTEYSCHSLGVDCVFDETSMKCNEQSITDRKAPVINDCQAKDLTTTSSYTIKKENKKCSVTGQVEAYSALAFYLTLSEAGTCSISEDPTFNFEDGEQLLTDTGGISRNQFFIYPTGSGELSCNGLCTFYVKCTDYNGNIGDSYTLEFIAKEAPDKAPPMIMGYSISSGSYTPTSTTKIDTFYLVALDNEGLKECRYASSSTADYNAAELMQCSDTIDMGVGGWKCTKNGGLSTPASENKYYFKCMDINNNLMPNWEEFKIYKTDNTLLVDITSPGSTATGIDNVLTAEVSGQQGDAVCKYDLQWRSGGSSRVLEPSINMNKESGSIYSYDLSDKLINQGRYDVIVSCADSVGQTATDEFNFVYNNNPLSFSFNPASVASASVDHLDVLLTVSGGREGNGETSSCRYKKFDSSVDLSTISFGDLDTPLGTSSQVYSIGLNLAPGTNRYYIMCEDKNARGNYYGEEYSVTFNPNGLVLEEEGNSEIRTVNGKYELDLYAVFSGGPQKDGSVKQCYYNDKYVSGMYENFSPSQYKNNDYLKQSGDVIDYDGKTAKKYIKTVNVIKNVPTDFYVRCVDDYNIATKLMKHTILYTGGTSTGGTSGAPECTLNSDCYSGEICNVNGICVSSGGGTITGTGALTILSYGPNGNTGNKNVKLYITLTGGANEFGKNLNCYYNNNYDPIFERSTGISLTEFNQFFNTNRLDQSELLDSSNGGPGTRYYKMLNLANGNYTYYAACKDSADALSSVRRISFSISEDIVPPILQFYTEGSLFKVRLNEKGSCLVKQGDSFVEMSTDSEGMIHSSPARADKTYMIRCKDVWNNWNPGESDFITVVKNE